MGQIQIDHNSKQQRKYTYIVMNIKQRIYCRSRVLGRLLFLINLKRMKYTLQKKEIREREKN